MENNEMTRRDFLKGAGLVAAGALAAKLLHGKVYVPYVSDALEEKDEYDAEEQTISFDDLSKFYLIDYKVPYEISGMGELSGQAIKPNLVTFVEKEKDLYQKIYLVVNQDESVFHFKRENGQRYTEEGIQKFYNDQKEILRFINLGDYIKQIGAEKDYYYAEEIYEIAGSYQTWDLDYSSDEKKTK